MKQTDRKLNKRQTDFADNFLKSYDYMSSAVLSGYSLEEAARTGARLLRQPQVISYLCEKSAENAAEPSIERSRILRELESVAFANAADFMQIQTVETVDKNGDVTVSQAAVPIPIKQLPKEKLAAIGEIKQGTKGVDMKLVSKLKALELLGKHVGLFQSADTGSRSIDKLDAILNELNSTVCDDYADE